MKTEDKFLIEDVVLRLECENEQLQCSAISEAISAIWKLHGIIIELQEDNAKLHAQVRLLRHH